MSNTHSKVTRKARGSAGEPFVVVSTDERVTISIYEEDGDVVIHAQDERFESLELAVAADRVPEFVHAILEVEERIKRRAKAKKARLDDR